MTPDELSRRLRSIADRVDSSDAPSVSRISAEMKRIALELDESGSSLSIPSATPGFLRDAMPPVSPEVDVTDDTSFKSAMDRTRTHFVPDYSRS